MKSYTVGDAGSSSKFDVVGSNIHFKRFDLAQVWSNPPDEKAGGQLDDSCLEKNSFRSWSPEFEIFFQRTQLAI